MTRKQIEDAAIGKFRYLKKHYNELLKNAWYESTQITKARRRLRMLRIAIERYFKGRSRK